jgi:hypothetical protein
MSILTKIRQWPDNRKRVFSLVSALVLTLVILILWLSTGSSQVLPQAEESKLSSISPMQVIKDEFTKAVSDFKENTNQDIEEVSSSTTPVEIIVATTSTTTNQ